MSHQWCVFNCARISLKSLVGWKLEALGDKWTLLRFLQISLSLTHHTNAFLDKPYKCFFGQTIQMLFWTNLTDTPYKCLSGLGHTIQMFFSGHTKQMLFCTNLTDTPSKCFSRQTSQMLKGSIKFHFFVKYSSEIEVWKKKV